MRLKETRWLPVGIAVTTGALILLGLRRMVGKQRIQRWFWDPIYNRLAWLYDGVDWFTFNTTHRFRRRVWPYLPAPGSRLLEVGFGSGRLHVELARQYRLAGIDLAPGMVALTRRRLAGHGLESDLRQGSAYALPWPEAAFDAVVATFVTSALVDGERAFDEMIRVIRPGGRLIIVDAGEAHDGNRFAWALARLWEWLGDTMRDEAPLLAARGMQVERQEFGPWGCVHLVVGEKPVSATAAAKSCPL